MAEIRVTQEDWLAITQNEDAEIRVTQEEFLAVVNNEDAEIRATQVVWLAVTPRVSSQPGCLRLLSCE